MNLIKKLTIICTVACSLMQGIFATSQPVFPNPDSEFETYSFIDVGGRNVTPELFTKNPQEFVHQEYAYLQTLPQLGDDKEVDWSRYTIPQDDEFDENPDPFTFDTYRQNATQIRQRIIQLHKNLTRQHEHIITLDDISLISFIGTRIPVQKYYTILLNLLSIPDLYATKARKQVSNIADNLYKYLRIYFSLERLELESNTIDPVTLRRNSEKMIDDLLESLMKITNFSTEDTECEEEEEEDNDLEQYWDN